MRQFIFLFSALLMSVTVFAQLNSTYKLPKSWEKDFVIKLSFQGSMGGGNTEIIFTYDSCTYRQGGIAYKKIKAELRKGKIKDAYRVAILKRLQALKVDQVKSDRVQGVVNDGWAQSICFDFYCIEGGSSAEMSESDKNTFLDAYRYLEEFAIKHTRASKR